MLRQRHRLPLRPAIPADSPDVNSFTKVAEITRKLYRQTNADAVMSTAVNGNRSAMEAEPLHRGHAQARHGAERCEGISWRKVSRLEKRKRLSKLVTAVQDVVIETGNSDSQPTLPPRPSSQEIREVLAELGIPRCWRCR